MARQKSTYKIVATTYHKVPTGEVDYRGRNKYLTTTKKQSTRKETNFNDLKQNLFKSTSGKENIYVNYGRRAVVHQNVPRRLRNVTVTNKDGSKDVTYFKAVALK